MRFLSTLSACLLATGAVARDPQHVNKKLPERMRREPAGLPSRFEGRRFEDEKSYIIPQTKNTTKFAVNGANIPDVPFNIGESYAGLLPISSAVNASELYFWFFPVCVFGKPYMTCYLLTPI